MSSILSYPTYLNYYILFCSHNKPLGFPFPLELGGGGLRQGPITRAMLRHLEASKESEAPVQIKMLTILGFEDSCKNCKK